MQAYRITGSYKISRIYYGLWGNISITCMGQMMLKVCYFILIFPVPIPEAIVFTKSLSILYIKVRYWCRIHPKTLYTILITQGYWLIWAYAYTITFFLSQVGSALQVVSSLCIFLNSYLSSPTSLWINLFSCMNVMGTYNSYRQLTSLFNLRKYIVYDNGVWANLHAPRLFQQSTNLMLFKK